MKGRVKTVNDEREFGFIIGEDGNEYFFHFSNVISVDFPTKNSIVEFESTNTERGFSAKNIKVKEIAVKKPEFIICGHMSIRLDSIKSYAVYSGFWRRTNGPDEFVSRPFLEIVTHRNDEYDFYQDKVDFDIYKKKAELDKYLTM